MLQWILAAFVGFIVWAYFPMHDQSDMQLQESTVSQRAIQTVRYINTINDWRYLNPTQKDGVIADSILGWTPVQGLQHILLANRVYVYQADQPGLMAALLNQTRHSALVGKVISRRLIDSLGNDMQISVPGNIADGSLVYLN